MLTGCSELIQQAASLLPSSTELDTMNLQGHSALMLAAINNDPGTMLVSAIVVKFTSFSNLIYVGSYGCWSGS